MLEEAENNMADILIGLGQIGRAIEDIIGPVMTHDTNTLNGIVHTNKPIRFMHIAIPYSEDFVKIVQDYAAGFEFQENGGVIVYSTVPIGTCRKIGPNVAHSPVEGKHPRLTNSILSSVRWVGSENLELRENVGNFWARYVKQVRLVESSDFTEFLKLRSTSKYGINIVWTDYESKVAQEIKMPFAYVKEFDKHYNDLYKRLKLPQYRRYILDPPNGVCGGHCVKPNAKLLDEQYPDSLLKMIYAMGDPSEKH